MDAVVEPGKGAIQVPGQRKSAVLIFPEALKFLDEVEFEFDGNPDGELEGNVLVGEGSTVAARF